MVNIRLQVLLVFVSLAAFSQPPVGYYDSANGLSFSQLQQALHNIIRNHNSVSYTPGVWNAFYSTDDKPNGTVWDIYSDIPDGSPNGNPPYVYHFGTDQCGTATQEGDCYSREHSWPKSWFGGEVMPMYTDLFMLYPVDQYVNGRRSDYPYGKVGTADWTSQNGGKLGNCITPGYTERVFEPRDEYKGDLARSYFYMSVRYLGEDSGWPGSPMVTGSQMLSWAIDMMKQWSKDDPVSQKEIDRNNAVYSIQNNRNPFIDHPEYINGIWGTGMAIAKPEAGAIPLAISPNPAAVQCSITLPDQLRNDDPVVHFYRSSGERVEIPYLKNEEMITVGLLAVPSGMYFLTLCGERNGVVCTGKIIHP